MLETDEGVTFKCSAIWLFEIFVDSSPTLNSRIVCKYWVLEIDSGIM